MKTVSFVKCILILGVHERKCSSSTNGIALNSVARRVEKGANSRDTAAICESVLKFGTWAECYKNAIREGGNVQPLESSHKAAVAFS